MPLGFLLDLVENASKYPSMSWFKPCMLPRDLVYIGLRDLDTPEKHAIKRLGIKAYTVSRIIIITVSHIVIAVSVILLSITSYSLIKLCIQFYIMDIILINKIKLTCICSSACFPLSDV